MISGGKNDFHTIIIQFIKKTTVCFEQFFHFLTSSTSGSLPSQQTHAVQPRFIIKASRPLFYILVEFPKILNMSG